MKEQGISNPTFIPDASSSETIAQNDVESSTDTKANVQGRENWGRGIEFLLSCIAMSVGLGNVWRFPFIALANGGGAFVIPYIILLFLVGKPGYFLEMIMGQFSSRGTIKVFDCVPAMRGVGVGQMVAIVAITSYYSSILAITLRYFFVSFTFDLPWGECKDSWNSPCCPSKNVDNVVCANGSQSSAELYFIKEVLHAKDNISDGIGTLNWTLVLCLCLVWLIIFIIVSRGVRSFGKASYVTGIAPFIFLIIFLIRALTLPGSFDGIAYFFKPQWDKLLSPTVWYFACAQLFISLNVFFANIIMYSSYNKFSHNIYRDANIVTTIDTFTSLLAGCITFGIVGHLAHELKADDISKVFKGGPGLVFVTYAETIIKFKTVPWLFAIFFYLMIFILGIGSLVAMKSCIITVVRDQFPRVRDWQVALVYSIFGICCGSLYLTEGGQSVLNLVDHYGSSFVVFMLAIFEVCAFCYVYGVKRICKDLYFMLGVKANIYWKACWWAITPIIMTAIVIYSFVNYENPKDNGQDFPTIAHVVGWCISGAAFIWLPLICCIEVFKRKEPGVWKKIKFAFSPLPSWGPLDPVLNKEYNDYMKTH